MGEVTVNVKLQKARFVKTPEVESKKEEPVYDSDETVSAEEVDLNLANPILILTQIANLENKAKHNFDNFDDYSEGKEIISISSGSEHENAEQKINNALLWKSRPPKKCSKYLPEEVLEKHEIGWLQKRQAPFKSTPANALESFDENMSSMEPCFFQGGNEPISEFMLSRMKYKAIHSSNV